MTCRERIGKAILGFALQEGHDPFRPGGREAGSDFAKGDGREAKPVDGDFLAGGPGMGILTGSGVVIEAAEGVEIGAGPRGCAVELLGSQRVDAPKKR